MQRVVVAVVALALAVPAVCTAGPDPGRSHDTLARPVALLWGTGVFLRQKAFRRWLARHHHSYRDWARRHPAAVAVLAAAREPLRTYPAFLRSPAAATAASSATPVAAAEDGGSVLPVILLILGGLTAGLGALPVAAAAGYSRRAAVLEAYRIWLLGIGGGLLLGALVSKLAA